MKEKQDVNKKISKDEIWVATAPSNLALVKYAGKKNKNNEPLNASLSYTLNHLFTKVTIQEIDATEDKWVPLKESELYPIHLSSFAINKFLDFFQYLKSIFQLSNHFLIQSANNFPASIGAASSASSFCALTLVTHKVALYFNPSLAETFTTSCLSAISRQGSGSSCRSFFSPWALWEGLKARGIALPFSHFIHQLVLADDNNKFVSSSEAHIKIIDSPLFKGRVERANKRLSDLLSALNVKNWRTCFEIVYDEFCDLHELYESVSIFYRNEKSYDILNTIKTFWKKEQDGPLVTMDAGSSVHLLYRPDQKQLAARLSAILAKNYKIFHS